MKSLIFVALIAGSLSMVTSATAQQPFIHRPHFNHARQGIPPREPTLETYYLRKYGRLPPFRTYAVPTGPVTPYGVRWSDTYLPGYGYVPTDVLIESGP